MSSELQPTSIGFAEALQERLAAAVQLNLRPRDSVMTTVDRQIHHEPGLI